VTNANRSVLTFSASLLEIDGIYVVTLEAKNLWNRTGMDFVTIIRRQSQMPPIILDGPAIRSHYASIPLLITTRVNLNPCLINANISVQLAWTQTAGTPKRFAKRFSDTHKRHTHTHTKDTQKTHKRHTHIHTQKILPYLNLTCLILYFRTYYSYCGTYWSQYYISLRT